MSPGVIAAVSLVAVLAGLALNLLLVGNGRAAMLPSFTFGISCAALGAAILALAAPVRGAAKGSRRIDFKYALAVLAAAKAGIVVGALMGGYALGALAFVLTRPVTVGETVVHLAIAAIGGVALAVCGIIAEGWCKLPPEDDEQADERKPSLGYQ
ncbi:DUF3180 family protein [Agrococcus casei]|uniref:DUF3180 family protein n=1 Tax=Agrococcus casei TaxID=343512 RepID=UPI003F926E9D